MKVLLTTIVAGPEGCFQPGIRNLPNDLALRLIDDGNAEPVDPMPEGHQSPPLTGHETAAVQPARNAMQPAARPRRISR